MSVKPFVLLCMVERNAEERKYIRMRDLSGSETGSVSRSLPGFSEELGKKTGFCSSTFPLMERGTVQQLWQLNFTLKHGGGNRAVQSNMASGPV